MASESKWSVLSRAVKKIQFLLNFNTSRWRLASLLGGATSNQIQRLTFKDPVGLQGLTGDSSDHLDDPQPAPERVYHRSTSYVSTSSSDDDIDRRAEIFISNLYRQLRLERQISLELRYCRATSFGQTSSSSSSPVL